MVVKRKKPAEKRGIQWNGLNKCHKINIIVLIVDELSIIDDTAFTDLKGFITLSKSTVKCRCYINQTNSTLRQIHDMSSIRHKLHTLQKPNKG
jgi:hypothetical protein